MKRTCRLLAPCQDLEVQERYMYTICMYTSRVCGSVLIPTCERIEILSCGLWMRVLHDLLLSKRALVHTGQRQTSCCGCA